MGYLGTVWFFEPWMITFALLLPFLGNIIFLSVTGGWNKDLHEEDECEEEEGVGESKSEEGEKKSLKEKMQAMQDIALQIQKQLGFLAHVLESIKNVFNFSVPFLSWLAFVVVFIITIVLYFVPLRWVVSTGTLSLFQGTLAYLGNQQVYKEVGQYQDVYHKRAMA